MKNTRTICFSIIICCLLFIDLLLYYILYDYDWMDVGSKKELIKLEIPIFVAINNTSPFSNFVNKDVSSSSIEKISNVVSFNNSLSKSDLFYSTENESSPLQLLMNKSVYDMDPVEYDCYTIAKSIFKKHDDNLQEFLLHYNFTKAISHDIDFLFTPTQINQLNNVSYFESINYSKRPHNVPLKTKYLLVYGTSILMNEDLSRTHIQRTMFRSILYLQKYYPIKFVIFNNDTLTMKYANLLDIDIYKDYEMNSYGVPTMRYIYKYIEKHYDSEFYGYINGDIIQSSYIYDLLIDLIQRRDSGRITSQIFLVGRRSNIGFDHFITVQNYVPYYDIMIEYSTTNSKLNVPYGIDYFISSPHIFSKSTMDPVVIGRAFIDNYMVCYANYTSLTITSVDITDVLHSLHLSNNELHKKKQEYRDYFANRYFYNKRFPIGYSASVFDTHFYYIKDENGDLVLKKNDREIPKIVIK